ncbi:energy transducer TonB [Dechloromonas sp. H13]|uniref:energy transducer TonB n=1 Tax=Dechloromonas sp. H13 TaxID=2570193 RepID=UPI001291AE0E|nr:energy transducer TonB [Dechloromonas sp. H13]
MILERREEPGRKYALTFTILVHVGLLAFLFFGVQWKRSQPDVVEVELFSSRPVPAVQAAAPPPPPPPETKPEPPPEPKPLPKAEPKPEPPPPKKPDIAIKEEKKPPKPEPKKPEPEPKKPEPKPEPKKPEPRPEPKKPEPKPEAKPEPKAPDFSDMLKREAAERSPRPNASQQMAKAAAAEAEQRAAAGKKGLQDYANKIRNKVRGNIVLPPNIQGNPEAIFEVNQLPSGEVLDVRLKRSSGNPGLDAAIERAILKSSPLPKPDDPALFRRDLEIKYKPFEE